VSVQNFDYNKVAGTAMAGRPSSTMVVMTEAKALATQISWIISVDASVDHTYSKQN